MRTVRKLRGCPACHINASPLKYKQILSVLDSLSLTFFQLEGLTHLCEDAPSDATFPVSQTSLFLLILCLIKHYAAEGGRKR